MKKRKLSTIIIVIVILLLITYKNDDNSNDNKGEEKEKKEIILNFSYNEQSGLNYNDDALVIFDNEEIGKVGYGSAGKTIIIETDEGKHTIYVKSDSSIRNNKSNKVNINVDEENDAFKFNISQDSILGLRLSIEK